MDTHSKLFSVIFIPLFISAMDQPKKNDESIVKIIELSDVRETAFIGNKDLVIRPAKKKPFILNIDSQEKIDFIENKLDFLPHGFDLPLAYMVTDQAKKRILFSSGFLNLENLVIYDCCTRNVVAQPNVYPDFSDVKCRNSFDERNLHSVLLAHRWPSKQDHNSIISYNYLKNAVQLGPFISQAVEDSRVLCHHVFNNRLGRRGILSETKEEFKIRMESISGDGNSYKKAIPGSIEDNFVCSSDMFFIAYYRNDISCPHQVDPNYKYHCRVCDACYILNCETGKNVCCENKFGGVMPYAMAFHPNNKVVVTLSFDGVIEYFHADTGKLLGQHELSAVDKIRCHRTYRGCREKCLSFSADEELLVAAFKERCVVYKVPFKVLWGMSQDKAVWILWCLQNMSCFLPKDIRHVLLEKCKL